MALGARRPGFGNSLVVTLSFIAIVVPAQVVLGLAAATMLARGLPGRDCSARCTCPWICSPLAVAVLWRWILAPTDGAVSTVLGHRIEWLTDPGLALPVVAAVDGMDQRRLRRAVLPGRDPGDPAVIHAAARIDGADSWQRCWRITLPMLRPTFFFVSVTGVVSAAQVFDTVYALTGGGPGGGTDLVAHRIYAEAFGAAAIGRAAVMAMVLFVILVGVDCRPACVLPAGGSAMTSRNTLIYAGLTDLALAALITVAAVRARAVDVVHLRKSVRDRTPLSLPHPPRWENYGALGSAGFGRARR